ncbi:unnamed protein product [Mytilus edulis]|uniref:Uncharacterized protein n=1 Tax=Mytilus edulis TaxID=6550 RepID=A0A8S3RSW2_MYTED|nr:unnamed protein product [Mytilus edulis]
MQHRHTSRCTRNFPRFINVAILGAFIILLTVIGTDKCRDLFSSTTNIENAPEDTHKARDQGFIARHSLATTTSQKLTNLSKQHASKEQNKKGKVLATTTAQQLDNVFKLQESKEHNNQVLATTTTQQLNDVSKQEQEEQNGKIYNHNDLTA